MEPRSRQQKTFQNSEAQAEEVFKNQRKEES
jgi:hypothetical protein